MPVDRSAVEGFLSQEARLMDEHRYDEWLALWDPDATYWIPCNADDIDPTRNVSVVYDRRGQLRNRIQRLKETLWLRGQAPRLKRLVSNIPVESQSPPEVEVNSNFTPAAAPRREQFLWPVGTTHTLRATP